MQDLLKPDGDWAHLGNPSTPLTSSFQSCSLTAARHRGEGGGPRVVVGTCRSGRDLVVWEGLMMDDSVERWSRRRGRSTEIMGSSPKKAQEAPKVPCSQCPPATRYSSYSGPRSLEQLDDASEKLSCRSLPQHPSHDVAGTVSRWFTGLRYVAHPMNVV